MIAIECVLYPLAATVRPREVVIEGVDLRSILFLIRAMHDVARLSDALHDATFISPQGSAAFGVALMR